MAALGSHKAVTQLLMERLGKKEGLVWDEKKNMFVKAKN